MSLPNLLVIGAMKAGTSSLHDYLNQHPDIFMSEKKELDFFVEERAWKNGIDWYKKQFGCSDVIYKGESSQDYSKCHWWPGVPSRIKSVLGDNVKFIYIIRNPMDRIYSHYSEMQAQNCAPANLEDYIMQDMDENEIVQTSCYGKQIKEYLKHYDKKHFYFSSLECLRADKLGVLNEICEFLGVSYFTEDIDLNYIKNASEFKRTQNVIGKYLNNASWMKQLKLLMPDKMKNHLKAKKFVSDVISKPIKPASLSEKLTGELRDIFNRDFELFHSLTGKSVLDLKIKI